MTRKFFLNKKLSLIFFVAIFPFALSCDTLGGRKLKSVTITVDGHAVTAEIARTAEERQRGLMYRSSLGPEEGMLFVFDQDQNLSFWMKNTYIPLDIGYFDSQGFLIEVFTMKPDDGKRTYLSSEPALYALEMNEGWFEKKGIKKYAKLELPESVRR